MRLLVNITSKLGCSLKYKDSENKIIEQQNWQRFVDVSNTKSCIADCLSLEINLTVKFSQAMSQVQCK